jgi:hypothetical protein
METLILYYPKKQLKELFANQCEPCVGHPPCKGDVEKAKKWRDLAISEKWIYAQEGC